MRGIVAQLIFARTKRNEFQGSPLLCSPTRSLTISIDPPRGHLEENLPPFRHGESGPPGPVHRRAVVNGRIPGTTNFGIPIPSKQGRSWEQDQSDARSLKHILKDKLRSRRQIINSTSTNSTAPSPMISGASNPIAPELY